MVYKICAAGQQGCKGTPGSEAFLLRKNLAEGRRIVKGFPADYKAENIPEKNLGPDSDWAVVGGSGDSPVERKAHLR